MSQGHSVSVITRTFNRPQLLRRAIASVAAQTWPDRQLVVVNDGGKSVAELVDSFRDRLEIVLLEYAPDQKPGRCLAATRGIEASRGDWIAYLDDDDFYHPDHLETLMTAARSTGAKVLYTDADHGTEEPIGPNGEYVITKVEPGPSEDFSRAGFYCGCYIHLVTFCHHRKVFDEHGGFDPTLPVLEDLDLFYRYSFDYEFQHVKRVTAQYQIRSDYTNAVTMMRREFVETNTMLAKKYLHIAVGDMMRMLQEGRLQINGLHNRVSALEEEIRTLERRLSDEGVRKT